MKKRVWICPRLIVFFLCTESILGKDTSVKPFVYYNQSTKTSESYVAGGTQAEGPNASVKTIAKSGPGWKQIITEGSAGSESSESASSELSDETKRNAKRKHTSLSQRFPEAINSGIDDLTSHSHKTPKGQPPNQKGSGAIVRSIPGGYLDSHKPSKIGYLNTSLFEDTSSHQSSFPGLHGDVFTRNTFANLGQPLMSRNTSNVAGILPVNSAGPTAANTSVGNVAANTSVGNAASGNGSTVAASSGASASTKVGGASEVNVGGATGATSTKGGAAAAATGAGATAVSSSSSHKHKRAKSDSKVKSDKKLAVSSASGKKVRTKTGIEVNSDEVTSKRPSVTRTTENIIQYSDSDSDESESEDEVRRIKKKMRLVERRRLKKLVESRRNTRRQRIDKSLASDVTPIYRGKATTKKPKNSASKWFPQSWALNRIRGDS